MYDTDNLIARNWESPFVSRARGPVKAEAALVAVREVGALLRRRGDADPEGPAPSFQDRIENAAIESVTKSLGISRVPPPEDLPQACETLAKAIASASDAVSRPLRPVMAKIADEGADAVRAAFRTAGRKSAERVLDALSTAADLHAPAPDASQLAATVRSFRGLAAAGIPDHLRAEVGPDLADKLASLYREGLKAYALSVASSHANIEPLREAADEARRELGLLSRQLEAAIPAFEAAESRLAKTVALTHRRTLLLRRSADDEGRRWRSRIAARLNVEESELAEAFLDRALAKSNPATPTDLRFAEALKVGAPRSPEVFLSPVIEEAFDIIRAYEGSVYDLCRGKEEAVVAELSGMARVHLELTAKSRAKTRYAFAYPTPRGDTETKVAEALCAQARLHGVRDNDIHCSPGLDHLVFGRVTIGFTISEVPELADAYLECFDSPAEALARSPRAIVRCGRLEVYEAVWSRRHPLARRAAATPLLSLTKDGNGSRPSDSTTP